MPVNLIGVTPSPPNKASLSVHTSVRLFTKFSSLNKIWYADRGR